MIAISRKSGIDIWQQVRDEGAPLIERNKAIFVWFGRQAPLLLGDFNDWERKSPLAMKRVAANTWTYELQLPQASYIEYTYIDQKGKRLPDPFNPKKTPSGIGDTNHYFYMPGGAPTELTRRVRGRPRGDVTRHRIEPTREIANNRRDVYLYKPAVAGPIPLMVVWDGNDYLRRVRLNVILDNLIHLKRIRPLALALVQNYSPARFLEYSCNDATLGLLTKYILPLAQEHLDLIDIDAQPGAYGVMGASMGGLMALYAAMRLPHIFGAVLSQSGAFRINDMESIIFDLVKLSRPQSLRIWMEVGRYDIDPLVEANRDMKELLERSDYQVEFREYPGGHNYPAWRDELWRGLEYLFREDS